ncbi:MAG: hypothetical protein WCD53_01040 [Microcoleus sp.]
MQKKNWLVLGLDEVDRLFQYPKNKMPNYQLPITNYQLPITNYQLPITNYQLPITNARCPMPHPGATLEPNSHLLLFRFFLSCQIPRPSSLKAKEFDTASQSAESGDLRFEIVDRNRKAPARMSKIIDILHLGAVYILTKYPQVIK